MQEGQDQPQDSHGRGRSLAIVVLAIVVAVAVFLGIEALIRARVQGSIDAQTLGEEYVSAPCEVRRQYDGRKWTVTGVVLRDAKGVTRLSGGTHFSDGNGCSGGVFRPFVEARWYNIDLMLHGDDSTFGVAEVGSTITVTCRIKLIGFGFNDGDGSISGSSCVPMEPDDS